ncbi:MAG: polysaccharide deacetylase family protein [Proteobacteria bacterium]|nr:polysaccharide deacetylase family protein [Pseudomonadota bacterium]
MAPIGQLARGVARRIPPFLLRHAGRPAAVYFHGVERCVTDPLVRINHHDRDAFYKMAKALKQTFQVLPLGAVCDVLKNPERHARTVFLMSDDGYANTLSTAAGILEELGLPWTLFVSTHHIDTGARNPMFLLRLFFRFAPPGRYAFPNLGALELAESSRDALSDSIVARLRGRDAMLVQQTIDAMMQVFSSQERDALLRRFPSEIFLSWDQVRELAHRGVEIGAHAHRHWPMNEAQSIQTLIQQASAPRIRIIAEVGHCRLFAYPFGNVGDVSAAAWQAVREAGYDYAFTTLSGTLDASRNPFLMPRYGIGPHDRELGSLVPLLRTANRRLVHWQERLGSQPLRFDTRQAAE